jgi:predicted nuclease of predicted toxin-antitoxin system
MRILLDECLPARLRRDLPGHEVLTVPRAGWAGVKNGHLLRLIADSNRFDVSLSMDKHLPHQQQITALPFAVVVLQAKSNRYEDTHPLMPEVVRRLPEFEPGHAFVVPGPCLPDDLPAR